MSRTMNVQLQLDISAAERQLSQFAQNAQKISKGGSSIAGSLGGAAGLAGASAVAAGVAAVSAEFKRLGDRARELASTAGNASSQLGQLRSAMEKNKISSDIAAISPSVVGFQKFISDIGTNIDDFWANKDGPQVKAAALKERLAGGLGQGNEDWRRLKEQGVDLQQDIGIARTALQVKWQRSERDFALEQRKFAVDTQNQVFDLQKQASRQQFDQAIAIQKFQENFANQQSQKAYDLSRQFAAQSFAISQGRAIQDYSINRADKQADFARTRGDQKFDYNLSRSRSMEDRNIQLQDMALSGASGLDYFRAARSYNLQQGRAAQDFQIQQARESRDFGIGMGRDARNFGISQGRSVQDFQQQAKEALASRQLELEAQEYARKYEGLELQTQINRQSQDLAISFQRLNQSIGFQQQGFANQASDMAYDKRLDYSNFALQTGRQNRNYGYALDSFVGAARNQDPLGALGLSMKDPAFAAALAANSQRIGLPSLQSQVQASLDRSNNSFGGQAGTAVWEGQQFFNLGNIGKAIQDFQKIFAGLDAFNAAKNGGSSNGTKQDMVQFGGNTYNFNPGMDQNTMQQIQQIVDQGDAETQNKIMDVLRRQYGG